MKRQVPQRPIGTGGRSTVGDKDRAKIEQQARSGPFYRSGAEPTAQKSFREYMQEEVARNPADFENVHADRTPIDDISDHNHKIFA